MRRRSVGGLHVLLGGFRFQAVLTLVMLYIAMRGNHGIGGRGDWRISVA